MMNAIKKLNEFIMVFEQMENSTKVSKKPLKKLDKLINDISSIRTGPIAIAEVVFNYDSMGLSKRLDNINRKLELQNSKVYKQKNKKLNEVSFKLLSIIKHHEKKIES